MVVNEKYIWEHKQITNKSDPEIILHTYSLHQADLNYIGIVPVRIPLIFTDFPTGSVFHLCPVLEICKYQKHQHVYWENSNVVVNWLMQTIIVSHYFWDKCIGYFFMLPNTFFS